MLNTTKAPRANLNLESLEDRLALTSYIDPNGDLIILGSHANDTVTVTYQAGGWFNGLYSPARYIVNENGVTTPYHRSLVWGGEIRFNGYNGNNYFRNDTNLSLWAWGGENVDTLIGSDGVTDHLFGFGGDDWLYGRGGNDDLQGGWNLDHVYGGFGNDWVDGGAGDGFVDYLAGGTGNPYLDSLGGGSGADGFAISWFGEHDILADYNYYDGDWIWYVDLE